MLKTFTRQQKNRERSSASEWVPSDRDQKAPEIRFATLPRLPVIRTALAFAVSLLTKVFSACCLKAYIISSYARLVPSVAVAYRR